ncbi:MAG: choice-of-anchor D domain-containing protein, partial [Dehalococcoidia bacterium]|nr:choice-of-anchor D domain-containing protein [Dehalococcoidia bacterium]
MAGYNSKGMGGRSRFCRIALLALGLTAAITMAASATYTDTFSSSPWGTGTTGSFTTGTSATGLSYSGSPSDLFAWSGSGEIDCDALSASGSGTFTITSRDGKAFVFNSLEWDDDAGGATITGTGPEPFTINISSGGVAQTRSPSGGSKLVTEVEISSSYMWALMDDVSVELDVPGAAVYGNCNLISNGDSSPRSTDGTDLGVTPVGTLVIQDFELENVGDASLTVNSTVTVSGTGFSITQQPSSPIAVGGSSTFTVQFNPTAAGSVTGTVTIDNNSEADDYTFSVTAEGDADTDPPGLASFERQTPAISSTNADTLVFRATFDEDVQYVSTGDFAVSGTTATVTNVNAVSAAVYDLTVSGGDLAGYDGTVGIDL